MATSPNPPVSNDSSPVPVTLNANNPRPVSYISSRMTDIASEDGDSRPHTAMSTQPPQSRRAPPPLRNSFAQSAQGVSRPPSSGSRMSRTHVPSLAAHGFFRPMSSQRLQAQRSARPLTTMTNPVSADDGQSEEGSQVRRSIISATTAPQATNPPYSEIPPPSRGTEFTDPVIPDQGTSNGSPTGNTTVRSLGDNIRLLNDRSNRASPSHLNIGNHYNASGPQDPPERSPLSFRSGFLRTNKNERRDSRGHERLSSSAASTPRSPSKPPESTSKSKLGKNYEYFMGNIVFFGGGRFLNSRDRPVNIATGIFLILPGILFFVYSCPWLWHNVSPAIPIIFAYIFFLCVSSFFHASLVDPGIIPRNLHIMPEPDSSDDPLALGPPTSDWVMIKLATSDVAAMDVPVKYCKTCNVWRPPRSFHCRVCNNCIETLDHHCVWLNNCVGRRNYRYFFGFVASATILAFFLFGASLAHCLLYSSREGISFGKSINELRIPFAMVIYGALSGPYPASLWAYHLFLMGRGETTREYLNSRKFSKADRHRPYTQGSFLKNWITILGKPRPPTYLKFKQRYETGDQRLGPHKVHRFRRGDLGQQNGDVEMGQVKAGHPPFEGPASRGGIANQQSPQP